MKWTIEENDMVGGWIVTTYPHRYSQHGYRDADGNVQYHGKVIAECSSVEDAQRIATLLNEEEDDA